MSKRKIIIVAHIILITTALIGLLSLRVTEKDQAATASRPPTIRSFEALAVQNETPSVSIPITGRIRADEKVDLYAEVSGKLLKGSKAFKEGMTFRKGETLLQVDAESFVLDLNAQKSNFLSTLIQMIPDLKMDFPDAYAPWEDYLKGFRIEDQMRALPMVADERVKYFLSARGVYNQYYSIQRLENDLKKYRIPAPFTGVVGVALVNPGTQISPQTRLGEFSSIEIFELETSLSLSNLPYIEVGDELLLVNKELDGRWKGVIHRIGQIVDDSNQQLSVFIRLTGDGLKEGMFLEGVIDVDRKINQKVAVLPSGALIRNNQVYVVEDSLVLAKPVVPTRYEQQHIWVTGLQDGETVITDPGDEQIHGIKAIAKLN